MSLTGNECWDQSILFVFDTVDPFTVHFRINWDMFIYMLKDLLYAKKIIIS